MKNLFWILMLFLLYSCQKQIVLFKDDFEHYKIGYAPDSPWKTSGKGIAVIDTTRSTSGKKSIHFVSGEGYANRSFIEIDHIFPVPNNRYFGKLNMYVEHASPDGIHWTMVQSSGVVPNEEFRAEVRYGGQHQKKLMANYDTQGKQSDCWQHSNTPIPEKKWFTMQWMFDGNLNTMKLWIDDVFIDKIAVTDQGEGCVYNDIEGNWKFPVFENVLLGWVDYQTGGGTRSIWIDDVVLATHRITQ